MEADDVKDLPSREPGAVSLSDRVAAHLAHATGAPVEGVQVESLPGGACQDLFRVDAVLGGVPSRFVLRSDALTSLPGSLRRAVERRVLDAAVAAGVQTPAARWPAQGLVREGADAYFLDWCPGTALGARVLRAPELAAARETLPASLAKALARLHAVTRDSRPELATLLGAHAEAGAPRDPADQALATLRGTLDALARPSAALELAFAWLDAHRPPLAPAVLVHGDFRVGNFMVDEDGLTAVLDWEFAHFGAAAEDVGWLCVRDWRFGVAGKPAGGLCTRQAFLDAYAAAGGTPPTLAEVAFYEILGNVRWAGGCRFQAQRARGTSAVDLELLAIGERAAEMEYEALRLIAMAEEARP